MIQNSSRYKILQILVIRVYGYRMYDAFKKMTPLLERIHYSKEFFIVNLVVDLNSRNFLRVECNRMKLFVCHFAKVWLSKKNLKHQFPNRRLLQSPSVSGLEP